MRDLSEAKIEPDNANKLFLGTNTGQPFFFMIEMIFRNN